MKDRLSGLARLGKAFRSSVSAVEIELAALQRERHLAAVRLNEMGEALLSPDVVGLPIHSRMLYRIAELESQLVKADRDITGVRGKLMSLRSRQEFCDRQVTHLSYVLTRKKEEDEALEVTAAMMASASGKSTMFE